MRNRQIANGFLLLVLLLGAGAGKIHSQSAKIKRTKEFDLCARVALIKELPYSDGETGVDSNYDALYQAGQAVVPCLIDKITDTTVMRDPRCPTISKETKVGDVAYFVLIDITKLGFVEMLPASVQNKFKTEGVYAYHRYIEQKGKRKELQLKLRQWYAQRQKP